MQENLVGYLLGALEADEHESVKCQLEKNPELRQELSALEARLAPLESGRWQDYDPPAHLASATCAMVAEIAADSAAIDAHQVTPRMSSVHEPPRKGASWSLMDMVVTAGIFAAIACLFLPSIGRSLDTAKVLACQNNLKDLFGGLSQFSTANKGAYPTPQVRGDVGMAGVFASQLVEPKFASYQQIVCPTQQSKRTVALRIPTMSEVQQQQPRPSQSDMFAAFRKVYGYSLGHFDDEGRYQRPRSQGRSHVALVADRPAMTPYGPANVGHRGHGMNVLMEDGSVKKLPAGVCTIGNDNIFVNDEGRIGPGVNENDSVIGMGVQRVRLVVYVPTKLLKNLPPGAKAKVRIRATPSTATPVVESSGSVPAAEL